MHLYRPTERGIEIARAGGLDELAKRISSTDENRHPLLNEITRYNRSFSPNNGTYYDKVIRDSIAVAVAYAREDNEIRVLRNGLSFVTGEQNWRYFGEYAEQTLFPHRKVIEFKPSTAEDQLTVSGIVGVTLRNFKSRYPILARNRFAEYGFDNHMEACAFAGAYVVGQMIDTKHNRFVSDNPSFEIVSGNTATIITVAGTMHGDFIITSTKRMTRDVISPACTFVEFAPEVETTVGGYHSVEPDVVVAMITDEYLKRGRLAAIVLISEFSNKLNEVAGEDDIINYRAGPFADYGSDRIDYHLIQLEVLLNNPATQTRTTRSGKLYSAPYSPQSPHLFEIKPTINGIRFQGRNTDSVEPESGIDIPRAHFPDLFKALLMQAQGGLGRTSPSQHVQVLKNAFELLRS